MTQRPKFDAMTGEPIIYDDEIANIGGQVVDTKSQVAQSNQQAEFISQEAMRDVHHMRDVYSQKSELVAKTQNLTPTQILDGLSDEERQKAYQISQTVSLNDDRSIQEFGHDVQAKLDAFSDANLARASMQDSEMAGELLMNLMTELKEVSPEDLANSRKKGLIPFFRKKVETKIFETLQKTKSVQENITNIQTQILNQHSRLMEDMANLDQTYHQTKAYFDELTLTIAGGQLAIVDMKENQLKAMQEEYQKTGDPMLGHEIQTAMQTISSMSQKLNDLILVQNVILNQSYQMAITKRSQQVLTNKLLNTNNIVIPIWKDQISMSIQLLRSEESISTLNTINETTNKLIAGVSGQVKDAAIATAKLDNTDVIQLETIKKLHTDLIDTTNTILEIQENGEARHQRIQKEVKDSQLRLQESVTKASNKMLLSSPKK